jgi:hypothetical protein
MGALVDGAQRVTARPPPKEKFKLRALLPHLLFARLSAVSATVVRANIIFVSLKADKPPGNRRAHIYLIFTSA